MTIIDGTEVGKIKYKSNIIKDAIENNDPIEEKLNVIIVISNPCLYKKRYKLAREFIKRLEKEETNIVLYIVELSYGYKKHMITNKNNKKHLQLRTTTPLWHKENMINLGVKYLLPENYKAFAWIDADIEFENNSWAMDTLKVLNGTKDIVQLFSHCLDMDKNEMTMRVVNSAGFQYSKEKQYCGQGENYWHPGYAWAITRKAYEKIGGLYEYGILGSGDNIMMLCLLGNGLKAINDKSTKDYKNSISIFQNKIKKLRFGYVSGVIRHYFHGAKINRKYKERWQILINHNYSPYTDITYDKLGLIITNNNFNDEFKKDIYNYFLERNEDEE